MRRRKADKKRLISSGVMLGLGLLGLALILASPNAICIGLCLILGVFGVVRAIEPIKRYRAKYAQMDIQLASQKSLFDDFRDLLPALVNKSRGSVYYWEAQEWQDWMDKKGSGAYNAPYAYHSQP